MLKTQKTEDFNRRLNNHRKDVNRKGRIPASNHLGQAFKFFAKIHYNRTT